MSADLAGTWEMIRAEQNGEESPELVALRVDLTLTADTYVVRFAGKIADRGLFVTAANSLMLTGTEGPNQGRTIPCIFELAGDHLRVCYGLGGSAPEKFSTSAGSPHYLATYRRKIP